MKAKLNLFTVGTRGKCQTLINFYHVKLGAVAGQKLMCLNAYSLQGRSEGGSWGACDPPFGRLFIVLNERHTIFR